MNKFRYVLSHNACEMQKGFFSMIFLLASVCTLAQSNIETINNLCYKLDVSTHTATLMPNKENLCLGDIVVPEKVETSDGTKYTVTKFGDGCFENCSELTSIIIPLSVVSLGNSCF